MIQENKLSINISPKTSACANKNGKEKNDFNMEEFSAKFSIKSTWLNCIYRTSFSALLYKTSDTQSEKQIETFNILSFKHLFFFKH